MIMRIIGSMIKNTIPTVEVNSATIEPKMYDCPTTLPITKFELDTFEVSMICVPPPSGVLTLSPLK